MPRRRTRKTIHPYTLCQQENKLPVRADIKSVIPRHQVCQSQKKLGNTKQQNK